MSDKSIEQFIPDGYYEQSVRSVLSFGEEIGWDMTLYSENNGGEKDVDFCIFDVHSSDGCSYDDAIVFCSLAELKAVKNFLDCLRSND